MQSLPAWNPFKTQFTYLLIFLTLWKGRSLVSFREKKYWVRPEKQLISQTLSVTFASVRCSRVWQHVHLRPNRNDSGLVLQSSICTTLKSYVRSLSSTFTSRLLSVNHEVMHRTKHTRGLFHEEGLGKSLVYFSKSGLFKWEFGSITVAYMNPSYHSNFCWQTSLLRSRLSSLVQLCVEDCPTVRNRLFEESSVRWSYALKSLVWCH